MDNKNELENIKNDLEYIKKNKDNFNNLEELGKGNFGKVMKISPRNNVYYAIKIINKPTIENINDILREKIIMKNIKNDNVIQLFDNFEDNDNIYFILEYLPNGTLENLVKKHKDVKSNIDEFDVIRIFRQILNGLKYLHELNIIHRDIKPDNILFDKDNNAKITDFGISAPLKQYPNLLKIKTELLGGKTNVGHKDYSCPEIVNEQPYDKKCDIYSLGLTIFYLMTFDLPHSSNIDISQNKIKRKKKNVTLNQNYNEKLRKLIMKMISEEPNERPTAEEAYNQLINIDLKKIILNSNLNIDENIFEKSSSFISIIRVLSEIEDLNLYLIKKISVEYFKSEKDLNNFIPFKFVNIMYDNYKEKKEILDRDFKKLRNLLSSESENKINKENETNPIIFFEELFSIFLKQFKSKEVFWKNTIFNNLKKPEDLPEDLMSEINNLVGKIEENEYPSPFIDIFYFITLDINNCTTCEKIHNIKYNFGFSMLIETKEEIKEETKEETKDETKEETKDKTKEETKDENKDKTKEETKEEKKILINLIKKKLDPSKPYKGKKCPNCGFNTVKDRKFFYNSPLYLLIKFKKQNPIPLDKEIDLTPYIKTNVGPKKYDFFALISEEELEGEKHYVLIIKKEEKYLFCSDNIIENCGDEVKTYGNQLIAIYKGQK